MAFKERKRGNPRWDKENNFFGESVIGLICTVIEIGLWRDVF